MDKPLLFPKRQSTLSTSPKFQLTKYKEIEILRAQPGQWVNGRWQSGTTETHLIQANVQPLKGSELQVLPESDRTKESIKVYSAETLQTVEEVKQEEADVVVWNGKKYLATKTITYSMGVLDHTKTICVRLPETPQNKAAVETLSG